MPVPFLDLQAQYQSLKSEIDPAIQSVIDSCAFSLGPAVQQFEEEFASYCGVKHCIGVGSGTAALTILMQAHGVKEGDEVITAANSFFASAEAISLTGATPVLVDVIEETANMDPTKLENAITKNTKAILPVHLYGSPADMDAVNVIAKKHDLLVFEDAAQAQGSLYKGKKAGSLADGAAFSFYPGKNLGAYGEAGAITTNDNDIAELCDKMRRHGEPVRYTHDIVAYNERMDGIQGAVLSVKLKHLDEWNERRRENAELYRKNLKGVGDIHFIEVPNACTSSMHLFVMKTEKRDALQEHLKKHDVASGIHYPIPIHLQPAYKDRGWKKGDFPVAEKLAEEILSLPMYPELKDKKIDEVCKCVQNFFLEKQ
jgi:dTDP-4-amino-4,6-dideoxygalactose transaminase